MLTAPEDKGRRYHPEVIRFGIQIASSVSKSAYEKVHKLFFLPTRGHVKKCRNQIVNGGKPFQEGFQGPSARGFRGKAQRAGWMTNGVLTVGMFKDSMIMKQGLFLSSAKHDKNRLLGCQMPDDGRTLAA